MPVMNSTDGAVPVGLSGSPMITSRGGTAPSSIAARNASTGKAKSSAASHGTATTRASRRSAAQAYSSKDGAASTQVSPGPSTSSAASASAGPDPLVSSSSLGFTRSALAHFSRSAREDGYRASAAGSCVVTAASTAG